MVFFATIEARLTSRIMDEREFFMKILLAGILVMFLISCGRNAFVESESGGGVIITQPVSSDPNDPEQPECQNKIVSLSPGMANQNSHPLPFNFPTTSVGVPTHREGPIDFVMDTQIVLPFSLRNLNTLEDEVISIKLKYKAYQMYNPNWHHESQICHSIDNYCSGDKASVNGHLNHHANYVWHNKDFSELISAIPSRYHNPNCSERDLDIEWDVMNAIAPTDELLLNELPDDYSVIIADDHYIKSASLEIEYCSFDEVM